MASASLLINGIKPSLFSSADPKGSFLIGVVLTTDIEPFDAELLTRVQSLHREIEQKTLEVTTLRRTTPMEAATLFEKSCNIPNDLPVVESMSPQTDDPPIEIPREDEIKDTFTRGMKMLKELKKGVPATSAKLERAKEVVTYVYS